jgi:stalled ribosome rescue protein Dom34
MTFQHAIVWLDHHDARIIDFTFDDQHLVAVHSENGPRKLHRKAMVIGSGKAKEDHHFFDEIVAAIGSAQEVLLVGPGTAKLEFEKDLAKRHAEVAKRIVGMEPLDHPSDGQLLAFARKYFKRYDALQGG